MQHIKGISLLLSIWFVLVLTNITAICVADANPTPGNDTLLNVTNASSKDLTTQDSRLDNFVEGYDMEAEPVAPITNSDDFAFSKFDLVASLMIIVGIGTFFLVALLAVVAVVLKSGKKKKN